MLKKICLLNFLMIFSFTNSFCSHADHKVLQFLREKNEQEERVKRQISLYFITSALVLAGTSLVVPSAKDDKKSLTSSEIDTANCPNPDTQVCFSNASYPVCPARKYSAFKTEQSPKFSPAELRKQRLKQRRWH